MNVSLFVFSIYPKFNKLNDIGVIYSMISCYVLYNVSDNFIICAAPLIHLDVDR